LEKNKPNYLFLGGVSKVGALFFCNIKFWLVWTLRGTKSQNFTKNLVKFSALVVLVAGLKIKFLFYFSDYCFCEMPEGIRSYTVIMYVINSPFLHEIAMYQTCKNTNDDSMAKRKFVNALKKTIME